MTKNLSTLAFLAYALQAPAQEPSAANVSVNLYQLTNSVFLTADDFEYTPTHLTNAHITKAKLDRMLHSELSKPEATDTNGNWGKQVQGFRLSLRFDQSTIHDHEQLSATLLLRNVTNRELEYARTWTDWDFQFKAYSPSGKPLQDLCPVEPGKTGLVSLPVYPHTQRRFTVQLDNHFDLSTPGEYKFQATLKVPRLEGYRVVPIDSGVATLSIAPPTPHPK
jgi:hypothetical protein